MLPLSRNADLSPKARDLATELRRSWHVDFDDSGAIGRRYRRQDEIGTPYCVTVDFETLDDDAVTVRSRDTMAQERVPIDGHHVVLRRAIRRLLMLDARHNGPVVEQSLRRAGSSFAALVLLATAGLLGGCSDDDKGPDAGESDSPSGPRRRRRSESTEPSLPVPEGVELSPEGSQFEVDDTATVAYELRQGVVGVLDIRVSRLEKTSFKKSFVGWDLDQGQKNANPYFVRATITNRGETDLGGKQVPLYIVDGTNTLVEATTFASSFTPCEPGVVPQEVPPGQEDEGLPGLPLAQEGRPDRGQLPAHPGVRPDHLDRRARRSPSPRSPTSRARAARATRTARATKATSRRPHPADDCWTARVAADNGGMTGLTLGPLQVATPVVLAPMAGITNAAYRRLCAEQGAGLYVCEMITSRGVVERDKHTLDMLVFDELETVRSVQLYGTDPVYVGKATEILCAEYGVAHVDLNFGCPVPKVTRKGGGGALPWKRKLLGRDPGARRRRGGAVRRAGDDEDPQGHRRGPPHLPRRRPDRAGGRAARRSPCTARTVAQAYSGTADWDAIGRLVEHVDIPVLGNGDIWEAADALRMVAETGAAGVVVGRGCLGRPWLFRDLAAAFDGRAGGDPARRSARWPR